MLPTSDSNAFSSSTYSSRRGTVKARLALLDQQGEPSVGVLTDDVQVITHPLLVLGLRGWHLGLLNEVVLDVVEDGGPNCLRLCRERQVLLHGFHKVLGLLQGQVKRSNADHQLL